MTRPSTSLWIIAVALLALIGATSCQEHKPQPRQTPAQLQDRLTNARAITDGSKRDQALHDVAVDAAASRVSEVSVMAVNSIASTSVRDDTAEQAAKILDERSDRAGAERVVGLMSDTSRR